MSLPLDITQKVAQLFAAADASEAEEILLRAALHDGSDPDARMLRCAVQASDGSLRKLRYFVEMLSEDSRDVIVAGEYDRRDGQLAKVRDLANPFSLEASNKIAAAHDRRR